MPQFALLINSESNVSIVATHLFNPCTHWVAQDFKVDETAWPPKFFKCVICTSDGDEVAFTNTRRFGRVLAVDNRLFEAPRFAKLGPDPFVDMPPVEVRTSGFGNFNRALIKKQVSAPCIDQRRIQFYCRRRHWWQKSLPARPQSKQFCWIKGFLPALGTGLQTR